MKFNRKNAAIGCCLLMAAVQFSLSLHHAMGVRASLGAAVGSLPYGLLFPGGFASAILHHATGNSLSSSSMAWVSLAVWFFPYARLRQWAGVLNPFAKAGAARPWLSCGLAAVLDWTDQRLFGRQKTGRWG